MHRRSNAAGTFATGSQGRTEPVTWSSIRPQSDALESEVRDDGSGGAFGSVGDIVHMPRAVRDAILDHARRALPDECCGLLIGAAGADTRIARACPARNLRQSPTRYLIDPADHFAAIRSARRAGLAVVGAYHSHPASAPSPSATDTREADDTELLYVIASPVLAAIRAYRLDGGRLRRVELRTTVSRGNGRPGSSRGPGPR